MKALWDNLWESLSEFKEELEEYISILPQSATLKKKQNKVMARWKDSLKLIREFDNFVSPIKSIEILFPSKEEKLINTWNFWKEYLNEQHGIIMRSRFEKKSLERLWEISEQDSVKAVEYLNYAMSLGYRNFFIVEKNQNHKKPKDEESADPFN